MDVYPYSLSKQKHGATVLVPKTWPLFTRLKSNEIAIKTKNLMKQVQIRQRTWEWVHERVFMNYHWTTWAHPGRFLLISYNLCVSLLWPKLIKIDWTWSEWNLASLLSELLCSLTENCHQEEFEFWTPFGCAQFSSRDDMIHLGHMVYMRNSKVQHQQHNHLWIIQM